ncbi:MAG: hypothetical protein EXX96DRAFT_497017 [Benjaminiella poitrasii]|nr:MAG: hypothetical protein EXX96DRAFT_497017 [Benjaminiella poitrasii]
MSSLNNLQPRFEGYLSQNYLRQYDQSRNLSRPQLMDYKPTQGVEQCTFQARVYYDDVAMATKVITTRSPNMKLFFGRLVVSTRAIYGTVKSPVTKQDIPVIILAANVPIYAETQADSTQVDVGICMYASPDSDDAIDYFKIGTFAYEAHPEAQVNPRRRRVTSTEPNNTQNKRSAYGTKHSSTPPSTSEDAMFGEIMVPFTESSDRASMPPTPEQSHVNQTGDLQQNATQLLAKMPMEGPNLQQQFHYQPLSPLQTNVIATNTSNQNTSSHFEPNQQEKFNRNLMEHFRVTGQSNALFGQDDYGNYNSSNNNNNNNNNNGHLTVYPVNYASTNYPLATNPVDTSSLYDAYYAPLFNENKFMPASNNNMFMRMNPVPSGARARNNNNNNSQALFMNQNGNEDPFSGIVSKATLSINDNLESVTFDWSEDERQCGRRVIRFWRRQRVNRDKYDGRDVVECGFETVPSSQYSKKDDDGTTAQPPVRDPLMISCIYWPELNDYFITSVDCIVLVEGLLEVEFTVEEKNRIRRNLEGFRPKTVSKSNANTASFFSMLMAYNSPKPRNIEKDIKVFAWSDLGDALKKVIKKYSPSYSSTIVPTRNISN